MSYILDALRKADAERERDPARGIHAQPLAGMPGPERRPRSLGWLVGAAAGVVLAAGVVYLARPTPPAAAGPTAAPLAQAAPVAAPALVQAAPAAPAAPQVAAVVPVANAVVPAAPPPAPAARVPLAAPKPAAPAPAARNVPMAAAVAAPQPAVVLQAPAPVTAVLKAPAAVVADRVLALSELPPEVQRELPKLAISGGVHSENAAQRMLIVGGQVVGEGAVLAPGVVLEQIRARTAVLQFRGYRFTVLY